MILLLTNIGKLKKADVEIKGITVIGGENNTGKSTVGKVLYSIFNSFYNIDEQIENEKKSNIDSTVIEILSSVKRSVVSFSVDKITSDILSKQDIYLKDKNAFKNDMETMLSEHIDNNLVDRVIDILSITDVEFFNKRLTNRLRNEFAGQINNIYTEERGNITLRIKSDDIKVTIKDNIARIISERCSLITESIYVDDPFILDELPSMPFYLRSFKDEHRMDLKRKLYFNLMC